MNGTYPQGKSIVAARSAIDAGMHLEGRFKARDENPYLLASLVLGEAKYRKYFTGRVSQRTRVVQGPEI